MLELQAYGLALPDGLSAMTKQMSLLSAVADRNQILASLASNHEAYLNALRVYARAHALEHGTVSIDDVRTAIERDGFPMPNDIQVDTRVFGAVFSRKEFEAVGLIPTTRLEWAVRVGRARSMITQYRLKLKGAQ